jgi:hypothetical protein
MGCGRYVLTAEGCSDVTSQQLAVVWVCALELKQLMSVHKVAVPAIFTTEV